MISTFAVWDLVINRSLAFKVRLEAWSRLLLDWDSVAYSTVKQTFQVDIIYLPVSNWDLDVAMVMNYFTRVMRKKFRN